MTSQTSYHYGQNNTVYWRKFLLDLLWSIINLWEENKQKLTLAISG